MSISPSDAICRFVPPFMQFLREGLAGQNMSPARFQLMEALRLSGPLTMIELAERLSVTKRNITTLVDGLEKDGLAARRPHPTDRRATLVELTAEGVAAFGAAAEVQMAHLSSLVETLTPQQQAEMAQALTQLTAALAGRARS